MSHSNVYSLVIAIYSNSSSSLSDWRFGDIAVDYIDFTREKSVDKPPPLSLVSPPMTPARKRNIIIPSSASSPRSNVRPPSGSKNQTSGPASNPDALSLQPLVAHFPGPNPLGTSTASGKHAIGRGVVHLFRHAPSQTLIDSLDAHPVGESSSSSSAGEWDGVRAEGEDGSLVAILAVPAWMRPADFLEFIGGWATCLEGMRMFREATTPNRSIVLLKFRDPLQASDFMVIFTGRPFSTLDTRETCHPIRIHHLLLHHFDSTTPVPAFPPSVYSSRSSRLLPGVEGAYELPSCPVCLERLDSTITGLVTLPCAHTFDCDCLRKWGDSRCPVCRVSHLLLATVPAQDRSQITRLTNCATCGATSNNWICVVCGVVGCGRYDPGKGHARRHWEESGHVLAMELDTQRVWDYKGDNYVHRLIQSRNDGKLVELPSASSLVTSNMPTSPRHTSQPSHDAGPSSGDMEKMSSIESITLEYSYLLSSQLEAMRQHYESVARDQASKLDSLQEIESRALAAEKAKDDAIQAKDKAEKRAEKAMALSRTLQQSLSAERAMSDGLTTRLAKLRQDVEKAEKERSDKAEQVETLEETVRDLMFNLEAGLKIQAAGGGEDSGQGGQLVVIPDKGKRGGPARR
ncbi:hypothetical protein BD324DRAFT_647405 [Kockovaella imperatae]|uniref:BRCA1-associated protein 2-domain-containing protein n=1 Tax=Kockovaella imperatae TaxID=4999 RepID=A0A1Y1UTF6_9TREE|nr:hypothetical protein BD324DRAFT_647405 [Kockovaella imperatae]ORX40475.1 hypothetical protein BD324DRAFT_647405 [Kockovaella imperatae]